MDKDKIMDAMEYIDHALIEEAGREIPAAKRGRRGWSRPAVIAACLCAVLAGTAVAAELSGVRLVDFFNHELRSVNPGWEPEIYSGYAVENDVYYFPLEALSPEIGKIDRTAERTVCRNFSSWEKLEEFVGLDIMENPVLEGAPAGAGVDLGIEGGSGSYVACVNAYEGVGAVHVSANGSFRLHGRRTYSGGWAEGVGVDVEAEVFTERNIERDSREYSAIYYGNDTEVSSEEYMTAGGITVQLFRAYTPTYDTVAADMQTGEEFPYTVPPTVRYDARFILKGIPFRVSAYRSAEEEPLLRDTILEVLDGFVCQPEAQNVP